MQCLVQSQGHLLFLFSEEGSQKIDPKPSHDQPDAVGRLLLCVFCWPFHDVLWPFLGHPPPPPVTAISPFTYTTMGNHQNPPKAAQTTPTLYFFLLYAASCLGLFWLVFQPLAAIHGHHRPPCTSPYHRLAPPRAPHPKSAPCPFKERYKNPPLILNFIEFLGLI